MPSWLDYPPIRARPREVYNDQDTTFYDVAGIIENINLNPQGFRFGLVETSKVKRQIIGRGNLDMGYIGRMSPEDAARPLLIIIEPSGLARLIDGYHRCARFLQFGGTESPAWVLSNEEVGRFILSPAQASLVERIGPA